MHFLSDIFISLRYSKDYNESIFLKGPRNRPFPVFFLNFKLYYNQFDKVLHNVYKITFYYKSYLISSRLIIQYFHYIYIKRISIDLHLQLCKK